MASARRAPGAPGASTWERSQITPRGPRDKACLVARSRSGTASVRGPAALKITTCLPVSDLTVLGRCWDPSMVRVITLLAFGRPDQRGKVTVVSGRGVEPGAARVRGSAYQTVLPQSGHVIGEARRPERPVAIVAVYVSCSSSLRPCAGCAWRVLGSRPALNGSHDLAAPGLPSPQLEDNDQQDDKRDPTEHEWRHTATDSTALPVLALAGLLLHTCWTHHPPVSETRPDRLPRG